jgi:hypothetical protein
MAVQKPLILKDGKVQQLGSGDTLDGSGGIENFSFHKIIQDKSLLIESEQHMICTSLEVDGFLELDGSLVFL